MICVVMTRVPVSRLDTRHARLMCLVRCLSANEWPRVVRSVIKPTYLRTLHLLQEKDDSLPIMLRQVTRSDDFDSLKAFFPVGSLVRKANAFPLLSVCFATCAASLVVAINGRETAKRESTRTRAA